MTTVSRTVARAALGAMIVLALAAPASAQSRKRVVKRPAAQAATLSGVVIDAATRAPLAEAVVRAGTKVAGTGADGRFTLTDLAAGNSYEISVTRWGYQSFTQTLALVAGENQLEAALQPAPIVSLKAKNGTTYPLDFDSVEFGYVVAFVGWQSTRSLHLCLPSGEEATVTTSEMKSVTFPGSRTESTSCCSLAPGAVARITKPDGSIVDGTIKESCNGAEYFVRGRNRTTGQHEAIKLSDVESVTF